MRTDSVNVSAEAAGAIRKQVAEVRGDEYVTDPPNRFKAGWRCPGSPRGDSATAFDPRRRPPAAARGRRGAALRADLEARDAEPDGAGPDTDGPSGGRRQPVGVSRSPGSCWCSPRLRASLAFQSGRTSRFRASRRARRFAAPTSPWLPSARRRRSRSRRRRSCGSSRSEASAVRRRMRRRSRCCSGEGTSRRGGATSPRVGRRLGPCR